MTKFGLFVGIRGINYPLFQLCTPLLAAELVIWGIVTCWRFSWSKVEHTLLRLSGIYLCWLLRLYFMRLESCLS